MSNARDKANIPALNFSSTGIDDNATSTAITIDSLGKVGIGTASPTSGLHIESNSSGAKRRLRIAYDGTYYYDFSQLGAGGLSFNAVGGLFHIWQNNGSEVMRIRNDGNVGIGTSSPSDTLHASDSGNSFIQSNTTSTNGIGGFRALNNSITEIKLFSYGTAYSGSTFGGVANANLSLLEAQASSNLLFSTWSNAGGSNPDFIFAPQRSQKVIIKSDGKVGIGTSSPSSTLDVNGSIRGDLELAPGKQYSMTSGTGTGTAIFDTNISLATFGILEVFYRANSNQGGTASYQQTGLYYIQVGTGFNGAIRTTISQTEVFKHVPFASPGALTFSSVIFDGSSEVSSVTSTVGCQIRIKLAGYNINHTGAGTSLRIRRIF